MTQSTEGSDGKNFLGSFPLTSRYRETCSVTFQLFSVAEEKFFDSIPLRETTSLRSFGSLAKPRGPYSNDSLFGNEYRFKVLSRSPCARLRLALSSEIPPPVGKTSVRRSAQKTCSQDCLSVKM